MYNGRISTRYSGVSHQLHCVRWTYRSSAAAATPLLSVHITPSSSLLSLPLTATTMSLLHLPAEPHHELSRYPPTLAPEQPCALRPPPRRTALARTAARTQRAKCVGGDARSGRPLLDTGLWRSSGFWRSAGGKATWRRELVRMGLREIPIEGRWWRVLRWRLLLCSLRVGRCCGRR
jgi:hypothetical protein